MIRTITLLSFAALFTVTSCVAGRGKAKLKGKPATNCSNSEHRFNRQKDSYFAYKQKNASLQTTPTEVSISTLSSQQLENMAPYLAAFLDAQLHGKPCNTL